MPKLKIEAETAQEASEAYCKLRDESDQGASTWPDGSWDGKRISYNGRVWDGTEMVFDPADARAAAEGPSGP